MMRDARGGQVHFTISGRLARPAGEVERLASRLCDSTSQLEPGTLAYAWYVDDETDAFTIEERYEDASSFADHMARLRENGEMRELGQALTVQRVDVWSGFDPLVEEQLDAFRLTFWRSIGTVPHGEELASRDR